MYSLKTFSSFPLFLDIWLSTTSKIYDLRRELLNIQIQVDIFCFIKIV